MAKTRGDLAIEACAAFDDWYRAACGPDAHEQDAMTQLLYQRFYNLTSQVLLMDS